MRKPGEDTIKLISTFEGLSLTSYKDSGKVLTIGYGHTGKDVLEGQEITVETAKGLLSKDIDTTFRAMAKAVTVDLTDNQFNALMSFCFNVGAQAFIDSTLLEYLNKKNFTKVGKEFLKWCHVKGRVNAGLLKRRETESTLFLT